MTENNFDVYKYIKIFVALLFVSLFVIAVSFLTLEQAYAAEPESESETVYQEGDMVVLSDGSIIDISETEPETEEVNNESENNVSDTGDRESSDVLSETDQVDNEGSIPSETVSPGTQNTEISDSTVVISDSTVYIQPLAGSDDESNVAALGTADIISLPSDRCITYEVTFNGIAYTAIFPLSVADSLAVSDGVLLNVGASAVTGRLFKNSFDTGTYGQWYITLNIVLATNGNTNAYRYGSWSYLTAYAPYSGTSQTNLGSDVTYGNFYVTEEPSPFSDWNPFEVVILVWLVLDVVMALIIHVRKEKRY